jgi:hypothetical protein
MAPRRSNCRLLRRKKKSKLRSYHFDDIGYTDLETHKGICQRQDLLAFVIFVKTAN